MELYVRFAIRPYDDTHSEFAPDISMGLDLKLGSDTGESAAEAVIEEYSNWFSWGKIDNAVFRVEISRPEHLAGRYIVSCRRAIKAKAQRVQP